jgi:hypothetical protein
MDETVLSSAETAATTLLASGHASRVAHCPPRQSAGGIFAVFHKLT